MGIFSVASKARDGIAVAGLLFAGICLVSLRADAEPDFRVLLTSPDEVAGTIFTESTAKCLGKKVSVSLETLEGRVQSVSVKLDGELFSERLDGFLSRNMASFPAVYSLSSVACHASERGAPFSLELAFKGLRMVDSDAGYLDAFEYRVITEGKFVSSQSSRSLGARVIENFNAFAREHGIENVPGRFDIDFCQAGPPCQELEPVSKD